MNSTIRTFIFFSLLLLPGLATSEDEKPKLNESESKFAAMLENATLKGTWAPIAQQQLGDEKSDGYRVVKAVKKKGNQWNIVSRVKRRGQEFDFPIPVVVEFAGDTAVMILNDSPAGRGQVWSARILFHDDVYAGSWWSPGHEKFGIVSGTISREKAE